MDALDQRQQAGVQSVFACGGQLDEAERLQPTLGGPHGKHDLSSFANRGITQVKDELNFQLFVERLLQVHQTAAGGKLMQFAANLALVGQSNQRQDRAPKLDAKGAILTRRPGYR